MLIIDEIAVNYLIFLTFMLFFHLYQITFFTFCVFLYLTMIILTIVRTIKKMYINKVRDFTFKHYYKDFGFSKENSYHSIKRLKKDDVLLLVNKLKEKNN